MAGELITGSPVFLLYGLSGKGDSLCSFDPLLVHVHGAHARARKSRPLAPPRKAFLGPRASLPAYGTAGGQDVRAPREDIYAAATHIYIDCIINAMRPYLHVWNETGCASLLPGNRPNQPSVPGWVCEPNSVRLTFCKSTPSEECQNKLTHQRNDLRSGRLATCRGLSGCTHEFGPGRLAPDLAHTTDLPGLPAMIIINASGVFYYEEVISDSQRGCFIGCGFCGHT
jgi:hypothetical protein